MSDARSISLGSSAQALAVGVIVRHPKKPEWGPGRVTAVNGSKVSVRFRNLPADQAKKTIDTHLAELTIVTEDDEHLFRDKPSRRRSTGGRPNTINLDRALPLEHALSLFKARFPRMFKDPEYVAQERVYKLSAHKDLIATLGTGKGRALLSRGHTAPVRHAILKAMDAVNLNHPIEKASFRDGIADDASLKRYAKALFALNEAGPRSSAQFVELVNAVDAFPAEIGNASPVRWPNISLFPFLWNPRKFMYMKPAPTKAIAWGVGFELLYDPRPRPETYERLHTLADQLLDQLKAHGAHDFVDVQSFIWKSARFWAQE